MARACIQAAAMHAQPEPHARRHFCSPGTRVVTLLFRLRASLGQKYRQSLCAASLARPPLSSMCTPCTHLRCAGGVDTDAAFKQLIEWAGDGDVLVLRASGDDA